MSSRVRYLELLDLIDAALDADDLTLAIRLDREARLLAPVCAGRGL